MHAGLSFSSCPLQLILVLHRSTQNYAISAPSQTFENIFHVLD